MSVLSSSVQSAPSVAEAVCRLFICAPASLTLYRHEYVALVGSFILVGLEALIRVLTLALRKSRCAPPERCGLVDTDIPSSFPCSILLSSFKAVI